MIQAQAVAPHASDTADEDYQHFFGMSKAERLAHLGDRYGCEAKWPATEDFYNHIVTSADTDGDGKVSPAEFSAARGHDLSEWTLARICEKAAAGAAAASQATRNSQHHSHHSTLTAGVPADADGAAFLQSPRLDL